MKHIVHKLFGMFWNFPGSIPIPPSNLDFLLLDDTDFLLLSGENLQQL